jgi:hypothetical protein
MVRYSVLYLVASKMLTSAMSQREIAPATALFGGGKASSASFNAFIDVHRISGRVFEIRDDEIGFNLTLAGQVFMRTYQMRQYDTP